MDDRLGNANFDDCKLCFWCVHTFPVEAVSDEVALILAVAHLILFQYIDGKEADGPNRIAPQGYITTASNILANAFGFSLRASLAIAFVQHLWHLLRVTSMKVSTIEALFCVRANPLLLFKAAVIRATPLLCALASIMWLSQVVTSFPPGAISIAPSQTVSFMNIPVPFFNASFVSLKSRNRAARSLRLNIFEFE